MSSPAKPPQPAKATNTDDDGWCAVNDDAAGAAGAAAAGAAAAGAAAAVPTTGTTSTTPIATARSFLEAALGGDSKGADALVNVLGVDTVDDLRLVDDAMADEASKAAGLKMVPAKKVKVALADLRKAPVAVVAGADASQAGAAASTASTASTGSTEETKSDETKDGDAKDAAAAKAVLQECVAVAIDRSGSMGSPFNEMRAFGANAEKTLERRSRMDAVKQVFYAFRDRTDTLGEGDFGTHQLGLLQFDDRVESMLALTDQLDTFEAVVDDLEQRGTTAIYSAIAHAVDMLEPVFQTGDNKDTTDLRVLLLTDGQNNAGLSAQEALDRCNDVGAVVDAIIVGDQPDENLRRIVAATGGQCFQIHSLSEGFELMESESTVSLRARRGGGDKPKFVRRPTVSLGGVAAKTIVRGSAAASVAIRPATQCAKQVVDVNAIPASAKAISSGSANKAGAGAVKRILKEIVQVAKGSKDVWMHSGEGVHIFPDADNVQLMKALIEGPPGSPFEGGVFHLNVVVPADYPMAAPQVTFETPVYHCNVSDSGRICLDILSGKWSPALSIPKALEAVRLMLDNPDTDNALRQWIAELTLETQAGTGTRYLDEARAATARDAGRSVAAWKKAWGL